MLSAKAANQRRHMWQHLTWPMLLSVAIGFAGGVFCFPCYPSGKEILNPSQPATSTGATPTVTSASPVQTPSATPSSGAANSGSGGSLAETTGGSSNASENKEGSVPVIQAVGSTLSTTFKSIDWAVVTLIVLLLFRRGFKEEVPKLLEAVRNALQGGGVNFSAGAFKLEITERPVEVSLDRTRLFSLWPFEIDPDPALERQSLLVDIAPQVEFQASDYVATIWAITHAPERQQMERSREAFREACIKGRFFDAVNDYLPAFAAALEAIRFLEARELAEILTEHRIARDAIEKLPSGDLTAKADDYRVVHAAGVAYAQSGRWSEARKLLDKITWRERTPYYLPCADVWLTSVYHDELQRLQKTEPDVGLVASFIDFTEALCTRGVELEQAMADPNWARSFPVSPQHSSYYQRELLKVLGTLFSILGDYAIGADKRGQNYKQSEKFLTRCIELIGQGGPTALDHNNLADLYRQEDLCDRAQAEMDTAFELMGNKRDPAFIHTQASIYWKRRQPLRGLLQLQQYSEAEAERATPGDIEQYVENQIFAAKLAANVSETDRSSYIAMSASLLNAARSFVLKQEAVLGESSANRLRAKIEELLGFAYLELPGNEVSAADAFQRLRQIRDLTVSKATQWRWKLGHAKALTRLARVHRRRWSTQQAEPYCREAKQILGNSEQSVADFGLDDDVALPRRAFNFALRLDTVVALQALAEESFCEGRLDESQTQTDQAGSIVESLRVSLEHDAMLKQRFGDGLGELRSQVRRYGAERSFLIGRILIRKDPGFSNAGLIDEARTNFNSARGATNELNCRIDLEFGELLLNAALGGKGDILALYEEAVAAFKRSAATNIPELQPHAVEALAEAYAQRPAVELKARKSSK
jgi:tetratricopeptide (TPR) repeat protein